jgi:hypothetical protein
MPEGGNQTAWAASTRAHGPPLRLAAAVALDDPAKRAAALADLARRLLPPAGLDPSAGVLVGPLIAYSRDLDGTAEVLDLVAAIARAARVSAPGDVAACRDALRAAMPALLALADGPDPPARAAAVAVLRELSWCADAVLPELQGRFAGERDPAVRLALVLAVGHLVEHVSERRRALNWLRRRRTGTDPALRLAATVLAWRTGPSRPKDLPALLAKLPDADAATVDGSRLSDWIGSELRDDRPARVAVARQLFEVRAGAGAEALRAAAGAICAWRSAAGDLLSAVASRLDDPDPGVRACAAHLLAVLGPRAAAHADGLADALADPAARVADLAAWGLSRMDDRRCAPRLRNRALIGTSVFDVVQAYYPRDVYVFSAPGLFDVLASLDRWAGELLPRIRSVLADADSYHQRRVLAAVLTRWGPRAASAVPELTRLVESDAAVHACAALAAIGPDAGTAGHRLFRLVERGASSRLRAAAAWAHWRVSGDPDTALRVLGDALYGELGAAVLPLVADLGSAAAGHLDRVRALGAAGNDWLRTEAARAVWLIAGDADEAWALLAPALAPLADGQATPVMPRAVGVVGALPAVPEAAAPLLRAVVEGDRRYSYYGDWRAVADDDELLALAGAALGPRG